MPLPGALHKGRAALSRSSSFHKDSAGLVPPFIFCGFFFFVIIISSLLFLLFFFFLPSRDRVWVLQHCGCQHCDHSAEASNDI